MTDDDSAGGTKKPGRPLKVDGPRFPQQEVDRLLVFGELVDPGDGREPIVVYPSYRELAQRYGVSHSVIAEYARKHNCIRRREQAQARIEARTDEKLIELRATAIAMSKDDVLRIIDAYILGFEKAIADGRVRFEDPSDFNTMVRLKQFIEGGADSRQEIHAALSLESLKARHKEMLQNAVATTAAERGEHERAPKASGSEFDDPPRPAPAMTPQEQTDGDFAMGARASDGGGPDEGDPHHDDNVSTDRDEPDGGEVCNGDARDGDGVCDLETRSEDTAASRAHDHDERADDDT